MLAAGAVAFFAADVPFGDLLCFYVVIDGVAAVAGGAGGALHVVGRIEGLPPIGALGDHIGPPDFVGDVPLCGFGEIVVADFFEVALLPNASVNESDVVFREFGIRNGVRR